MSSGKIESCYVVDAPREEVYRYWISAQSVIPPAARMQIEAKVGGVYRLIMPDGMTMTGYFREIEPMRRLRYSWQWDGADEISEVLVEFDDSGAGCAVRVAHSGFLSDESMELHRAGWDSYVAGFAELLRESAR